MYSESLVLRKSLRLGRLDTLFFLLGIYDIRLFCFVKIKQLVHNDEMLGRNDTTINETDSLSSHSNVLSDGKIHLAIVIVYRHNSTS